MEDEGLNVCECIWNYEAIQRLLSLLQQTQNYCIDNECFPIDHLPGPNRNQVTPDYLFLCIAFIAITFLYLFRPNFLRPDSKNNSKNSNTLSISKKEPEDGPPTPPSSMN